MAVQARKFVAFGLAAAWIAVSAAAYAQDRAPDVHFVPTPQFLVEHMLEMAKVTEDDYVIDLGSGDGRIPITAAKKHGARGLGVDIDPQRIKEANENLARSGVGDKVRFVQGDLFELDISEATVITLYLLQRLNEKLRPSLLELRPGTRIVSQAFHMAEWTADRNDIVDGRRAYLWIVPAKVEGRWQVQKDDRAFTIEIDQQFQMFGGIANIGDSRLPLRETALRGNDIRFVIDLPDGEKLRFHGLVDGDKMEAAPDAATWQAARAS